MRMTVPTKLGLFALVLLAIFAGAWGVGRLVDPGAVAPAGAHEEDGGGDGSHEEMAEVKVPGGLQIAQDGYRLEPATTRLSTSDDQVFRFRVIGPDGKPVTSYTTAHEKDLHLVVVRRDLTGFQHVHPVLGGDGFWEIPLRVAEPGPYRVFADFKPEGRAEGLVLGADVTAPGDYQPRQAEDAASVDGYEVKLDGKLVPGTASKLTLTVTKDGKPVTDLEPYLGAFGHLVALRDGDLAYLHVHPEESAGAGPQIVFYAEVPSDGRYALFLDFKHAGAVRTAAFSVTGGQR